MLRRIIRLASIKYFKIANETIKYLTSRPRNFILQHISAQLEHGVTTMKELILDGSIVISLLVLYQVFCFHEKIEF